MDTYKPFLEAFQVMESTGNECEFIERKPGEWYYVLEHYNAPKNAWDWREHADAYGPFPTLDAAIKHLQDNHANPGGWSEQHYQKAWKEGEVYKKLFAAARKRHSSGSSPYRGGGYLDVGLRNNPWTRRR